jgi:RecJ-like exonuclease
MTNNEMTIEIHAGDELQEISVSTKWEICERCEGNGKHDPESFSNGFTASEFNELFDDEDSQEDYFNGRYDVACRECNTSGKVRVPDLSSLTDEQREGYERALEERADYERECAAERRYLGEY